MSSYSLILLSYGIFIVKMVFTRQGEDEISAFQADKLNDFKNKLIEEIKSNIFELLKVDINKVMKEELKEVEKLNSTVALLKTHVENLKAPNLRMPNFRKDVQRARTK